MNCIKVKCGESRFWVTRPDKVAYWRRLAELSELQSGLVVVIKEESRGKDQTRTGGQLNGP